MLRAVWKVMITVGLAAGALPAWACFAPPGTKATHNISVIDVAQYLAGITVVSESKGYALEVSADDLLPQLSKPYASIVKQNDLADALRSKMASGERIEVRELIATLFDVAQVNSAADPARERDVIGTRVERILGYAFADLLTNGRVTVTELASRQTLSQLELDRFKAACNGGRLFISPEGREILRTVDWQS